MKKWIEFLALLLVTLSIIYALNTRIGTIPPLGKFLDPAQGVWQNALVPDVPESYSILIPGLIDEVSIAFNDRGVPHIFAQNDHDLYLAQGYITASHRLWQMEFSTHASIGRISEIVGKVAINYDRHQRRIGMLYGAEKTHKHIMSDDKSRVAIEAYSKGVNAWIDGLSQKTLPFEYKLLNYRPEAWTPFKTSIFYMNMNQTLTFSTSALSLTQMRALFGENNVNVLFPTFPVNNEPIISKNTDWDFTPIETDPPNEEFTPKILNSDLKSDRDPGIGSNNWAISGEKTASGAAIMSTDPHLTLSLPAIWYEAQLNAPGINAYGITLPGVPVIIMGFNENIAWGNTNTGGRSVDLFEVELSDDRSTYFHDGEWKPTTMRIESFKIRGEADRIDTTYFTHHGPIVYLDQETSFSRSIPVGHAIQWIAYEPSDPMKAFHHINRAKNLEDFRRGLSFLTAPTQNYVFASVDGDIAMQLNGLHPVRWDKQGKFISDGRNKAYDWKGFIPFEHLPREINPARNYVSSANQHLTDENYPYYIDHDFASQARSTIINQTLEKLENATFEDMIALQMNSDNYWASVWLDRMLDSLSVHVSDYNIELSQTETEIIKILSNWDRINHGNSSAALFFNNWQQRFHVKLWQPMIDSMGDAPFKLPSLDTSYEVLFQQYGMDTYVHIIGEYPSTNVLLLDSFRDTFDGLKSRFGERSDQWQWYSYNGSIINHLLDIPALNEPRLNVGGSSQSPNAISNRQGPSWRMVAEMTKPVRAWGVYPGGQSGNPASKGYNAFIPDWSDGKHYELTLFNTLNDARAESVSIIKLMPEK
jgi:penicillin amidase